jgi:exosortase/archaeosortase family protein
MKKSFYRALRSFFIEPRWEKVRGVFWFCLIILIFYFLWKIWANTFHFAPIQPLISSFSTFIVHQLFNESTYIIRQILKIHISTEPQIIITNNDIRLFLGESAAGLKQMCLFSLLIIFITGQWKHKAWFIPVGIVILHLTNVFRIICLVVIAMHWPQQIHYAHDNLLRILYYIVIFGLWVVWVEKIAYKNNPDIIKK